MLRPFVPFSENHLIAVGLAFVVPAILVPLTRPFGPKFARGLSLFLAGLLAVNWFVWMGLLYEKGWLSIGSVLPLNLCDWATMATVITLVRPNQQSFELAYFWALAGTLQGMMTPDVVYDFPDGQFILFFVFHSGIIASVLYMVFALGLRPVPQSIVRVTLWTLFYAAVAGAADWLLGTDYGFLRAKPPFHSVFDFMPAWPWYIPVLVVLGFLSTLIYYAPWFVYDRLRRPRAQVAA